MRTSDMPVVRLSGPGRARGRAVADLEFGVATRLEENCKNRQPIDQRK